jgi:hypothetical protein
MWKSGISKVVAPPVSVKDRGVGTREQVLKVPITCWYMCLVSCRWQLCDFLHSFYGCEGERNWMETRRSINRGARDVVRSFFFSRAVTLLNSIGDSWKVAIRGLCEIHTVEVHTRTERGKRVTCWSGFPLQDVHWFESPWLSDMNNRLSCGWHQVVN